MLDVLAVLFSLGNASRFAIGAVPTMPKPSFRPAERAVDNWRMQAALDLEVSADVAVRWLAGGGASNAPRCISLNNYWCLKKAGWKGELAADAEGHAAFGSAAEGAIAAAELLRRYYRDYGRKSARAIVAHWAPAQCGAALVVSGFGPSAPSQRPSSLGPLAKYGIGNTLRARWLAAHGRAGAIRSRRSASKVAMRRSVVPDGLLAASPPPAIALTKGAPEPPLVLEPPLQGERLRGAAASAAAAPRYAASAPPQGQPQPIESCAGETQRLANYAARAIQGIARSPDEDLKLFAADGSPLPALPRLLANMAAVEIGPYRADTKLIDAAVEAMRRPAASD